MTRMGIRPVAVSLLAACSIGAGAEVSHVVRLPEQVVTATREPVAAEQLPLSIDRIQGDELGAAAGVALDQLLGRSAAFSLFRRSDSVTAHPTSQGFSLRNIGPSGASRSLALLDGVPLNDPFGGWVAWSKVPRLTLGAAELVRGGGAVAWGGSALGGVLQLLSRDLPPGGAISAQIGGQGLRSAEVLGAVALGERSVLHAGARLFSTDGFHRYAPLDRGPVDRRLESSHHLAYGGVSTRWGDGWEAALRARVFEEERGNGTLLQRNHSRESQVDARVRARLRPDVEISLLGYVQTQRFSSVFSAVNDTHSAETPALDQFDVPATAAGAGVQVSWEPSSTIRNVLGADFRQVRGETREAYVFDEGVFQRRRHAGGRQRTSGAFLLHERELRRGVHLLAGIRADHWSDFSGHRREWVAAGDDVLRNDAYPGRSNWELSPSLGLVWPVGAALRLRAHAYEAFRQPTLNERYRPFRVGNVVTDANPGLSAETIRGAEAGLEWSKGGWAVSLGAYQVELSQPVANVTLVASESLVQRRRENLDRVRVQGLEVRGSWKPSDAWQVSVDALFSRARVERSRLAPGLEGLDLPQAPREVVTGRARWKIGAGWEAEVALRATGRQYEDDENAIALPATLVTDLRLACRPGPDWTAYLALDNATDEAVAVARDIDGRTAHGAPRMARIGLERTF